MVLRNITPHEVLLDPGSELELRFRGWLFLRVALGTAYLLARTWSREVFPRELVVLSPEIAGAIRASRLGNVVFHAFCFQPEVISGFLTVHEHQALRSNAQNAAFQVQVLPHQHPAAVQFESLVTHLEDEASLTLRATALAVVAAALQAQLAQGQPSDSHRPFAKARFLALMSSMPDVDMLHHTPAELAKECGCSLGHFNRLFRREYGLTIRRFAADLSGRYDTKPDI